MIDLTHGFLSDNEDMSYPIIISRQIILLIHPRLSHFYLTLNLIEQFFVTSSFYLKKTEAGCPEVFSIELDVISLFPEIHFQLSYTIMLWLSFGYS